LNRESIAAVTSDLCAEQREILLEMQGILSIAFVPVFSNNKLCGAIGFDDCTNERIWLDSEIEALHIVSFIIGVLCYKEKEPVGNLRHPAIQDFS
jgi:GAF domain-containing protein